MIPVDDPDRFNAAVDRFFRTPFVLKDRLLDVFKSLQREHEAEQAKTPN